MTSPVTKPKTKDEIQKELGELKALLAAADEEFEVASRIDKTYAENIQQKMFAAYQKGKQWLDRVVQQASTHLYVEARTGRRRNLSGYIIPRNDIQAALGRRAQNSPIQGLGADVGHTAARLLDYHIHKVLIKFGYLDQDDDVPIVHGGPEVAVHDALYGAPFLDQFLIILQVKNWCMTVGVQQYFWNVHGYKWMACPEIEMEIGFDDSRMYKWDWTLEPMPDVPLEKANDLQSCIRKGLNDLKADGDLDITVDEAFDIVFSPWQNAKLKAYLDKNYPWFGDTEYIYEKPPKYLSASIQRHYKDWKK